MTQPLFSQNVIAVIWDFDETLTPNYMQAPLFTRYNVDGEKFWDEVDKLPEIYERQGIRVSPDTLYLNHILTYVKDGRFKGLSNELLRELGSELSFFEGIPDFLGAVKQLIEEDETFRAHSIQVEHYVVSTGLRQMILGSKIMPYVRDVWGCDFAEEGANPAVLPAQREMAVLGPAPKLPKRAKKAAGQPVIAQVAYALDNTTKTRAVFEINKGTNVDPNIDVNARIAHEHRRVPFRNMIYIADGPSDIPVYSILNQYEGRTFAVYQPESAKHFEKANRLRHQDRVEAFAEAHYVPGSTAHMWITTAVRDVAERIVADWKTQVTRVVEPAPGHVVQASQPADAPVEPAAADPKETNDQGELRGAV